MKASIFGIALALMPLQAVADSPGLAPYRNTFGISGQNFQLNGEDFLVKSGEMHYPRIPRAYWADRLAKLKAMGLNTVSTYVFWNVHEQKPGEFDFSGNLDLAAFVKEARAQGLWVILRPSPYVCAEWEFGGMPAWLLKDRDIRVRSSDPRFVSAARRYLKRVGEEVQPLLLENGGPIIMTQVENEYGSFGQDREYMRSIYQAYRDAGFNGFLYTADSVWARPSVQDELSHGTLPGIHATVNFGQTRTPGVAFDELNKFRPNIPQMSGEYWVGWFVHYGETNAHKDAEEAAQGIEWMLKRGISFNMYMFHGGTNFGFMNGANWHEGQFLPDITSYDYDAPLDEAGRPREKYYQFRELFSRYLAPGESLPEVPQSQALITIPEFRFTESAPLAQLLFDPVHADTPETMEALDQSYGFILYRHRLRQASQGKLALLDVHDYAVLSQGHRSLGVLDRRLKENTLSVSLGTESPLDILVENMGRINFSTELVGERKGITKAVYLNDRELRGWDMYRLPMSDLSGLRFSSEQHRGPQFHRAFFNLEKLGDTYLDTSRFGKGLVFVNGHNLGRYWKIGPQMALYAPASWLKKGRNEVIVFDIFPPANQVMSMQGLAEPHYSR